MKAGQRYIITSGKHNSIVDHFVALRDFSFDRLLDSWLEVNTGPEPRSFGYKYGASQQDFLVFLRGAGFVRNEPLNEIHLSDYGVAKQNTAQDAADEPFVDPRP